MQRPGLSRRRLLHLLAGGGIAAFYGPAWSESPLQHAEEAPQDSGRIRRENQRLGTRDWILDKAEVDPATKYRCPWIEGFCSHTSIRAGETLSVYVSTNPPCPFRLSIYRLGYYQGHGAREMTAFGPLPGSIQPDPPIGRRRVRDCQWDPAVSFVIPQDWVSGVYLGKLTAEREGWQSYIVFIVRDDRRADFLFQCSDTTWQAYNRWPDQYSLYDDGENDWYWGNDVAVSFNRPYGKYRQIVDAPLTTGSGEFFLWEFPLAYWLEREGYDVTYLSNLDTHADPRGLLRAKGFLSVGHDEYYTLEMFQNLQQAVNKGVNLAFLSGNTCCGRIELGLDQHGAHRIFERIDFFGPRDANPIRGMERLPHNSPSSGVLVGARNLSPFTGGADWICELPEHWLFAGTEMRRGDAIPGLVGWEWHGDPAQIPGLEIIATGPTQSAPGILNGGTYTSTIYPGPRGNFVFNASTCWWADGLAEPPGYIRPSVYTTPRGPDLRVQRITKNVLQRMRQAEWPVQ